jgi:hypothetical protein
MKKFLFLLAIAGLTSFAACKSGETKADATADTTVKVEVVDTTVVVVDTTVAK